MEGWPRSNVQSGLTSHGKSGVGESGSLPAVTTTAVTLDFIKGLLLLLELLLKLLLNRMPAAAAAASMVRCMAVEVGAAAIMTCLYASTDCLQKYLALLRFHLVFLPI